MKAGTRTTWTFAVTSIALFMVVLDNLVVSTALPVIRVDLGATIEELEWTVNAYTLTFAVFLLTGAALGDRFGRKRMFMLGVGIFTAASAAAALAPSADWLIAARAVQGLGAAIVTPLTLTILSGAVSRERRGAALGAWSGHRGPRGRHGAARRRRRRGRHLVAVDLLAERPRRPRPAAARDAAARVHRSGQGARPPGSRVRERRDARAVWGLIHGNGDGWTSPGIVGALVVGAVGLAAFVAWELRAREPMLPMRFFRDRGFAAANAASLLMYFGMFGSIFLLTQFFQTAQGYSPLESGLRVLPWTIMPMFVAPIAGALSDRIGGRPLMAAGLALQAVGLAWIASVSTATVGYSSLVLPFVLSGIGMALFFAPSRTSSSRPSGRSRRARRPAPTTRSARLAASSAWRSSRRSSPARAATRRP